MHLKTKLIYYLPRAAASTAFYSGLNRLPRHTFAAITAKVGTIFKYISALITIRFNLLNPLTLTNKY